jgi:hypothetical protein
MGTRRLYRPFSERWPDTSISLAKLLCKRRCTFLICHFEPESLLALSPFLCHSFATSRSYWERPPSHATLSVARFPDPGSQYPSGYPRRLGKLADLLSFVLDLEPLRTSVKNQKNGVQYHSEQINIKFCGRLIGIGS